MNAKQAAAVVREYWLDGDLELTPAGGGTAGGGFIVRRGGSRYLLRQRSREQLDPRQIQYEHGLMQFLKDSGLPVHPPIVSSDGSTWAAVAGLAFELYEWVEGEHYRPGNVDQLSDLGNTMARFHVVCRDYPGKPDQSKEDDPARLQAELIEFTSDAERQSNPRLLNSLTELLKEIEHHLRVTNNVDKLPQSVVHGDLHFGNALFRGNSLVGLFDFDWANRRERARDIADGILFFCAARADLPDAGDIWSLTEFHQPDPLSVQRLVHSYCAVSPITAEEFRALPWIMAARLAQIRIRGMRKVPQQDRIRFLDRGDLLESIMRFANADMRECE